jgi:glucosyl-dolichyl phosphate glucuronosyltransferase
LHTISVVIPAYTEKRWNDLVEVVDSIKKQTLPAKEIIVVIDHNPALLARAKNHFSGDLVIENIFPQGASGSRNSGMERASGDFLAFIDDDAIASPDWLEKLMSSYTDSTIMGVGGQIKPRWDTARPKWFPDEFDWVVGCTYRGLPKEKTSIRNLISCNMSIRREIIETIGGFQVGIGRVKTLPVGCEETELCIRAIQHWPDRALLYDPAALVLHHVPESRTTRRYFFSRCFLEGYSKALISKYVGSAAGLSSERTYTFHTLPVGIGRGLWDVLRHCDVWGLARASMIVAGLAVTSWGYIRGQLSASVPRQTEL